MDFNQKSTIMRCKDIEANSSCKNLLSIVFDLNDLEYSLILENDLYQLMNEDTIESIIPFF